jgi:hypothetical protein
MPSSSILRPFVVVPWLLASLPFAAGCAADASTAAPEATAQTQEGWDSQAGNPTHATHSYLTEYAVDHLSPEYPELATYRATIIDGANQELHELPVSDPELEWLRQQAGGTNWAADHPEVVWSYAQDYYASGDKTRAYRYLGIVLHWVEDMGVPAHAFHVIHQGTLTQADNFEILALQKWAPLFDLTASDPYYMAPSDYVVWSGTVTASDFHATFPGKTYSRSFFGTIWWFLSSKQSNFVKEREGRTAVMAEWALRAAADQLGL